MKAMITAFVAIAVISVGAYFALDAVGFSSGSQQASDAVRLD